MEDVLETLLNRRMTLSRELTNDVLTKGPGLELKEEHDTQREGAVQLATEAVSPSLSPRLPTFDLVLPNGRE